MNKDIWKEILDLMPNDKLCQVSNICGIKVQGFRKLTIQNIKMCRPILITEAIKPANLKKVIHFFNELSEIKDEKEDEVEYYRSMNFDQLISKYKDGAPYYEILAALHSSQDQTLIQLAASFEAYVKTQELDVDNKKQTTQEQNKNEKEDNNKQLDQLREIIKDLELKISKHETKIDDLNATINKINKEYKDAEKEWKKEKKKLLKKETFLEQELIKQSKDYLKKEKESTKLLDWYKEELENRNAEISHLNAKILNANTNSRPNNSEKVTVLDSQTNVKQIALVGNPKNNITNNKKFDFRIFEASELEVSIKENDFDQFEEVWMLTYRVSQTKQKLLNEKLNRKIYEISTFMDLKRMVEKG